MTSRPLFSDHVLPSYFVVEPKPVYERMFQWEKANSYRKISPKELRTVKNRFREVVRAETDAMIAAGLPIRRFPGEKAAKTYAAEITAKCNVVPSVIECTPL